MFDLVCHIVAAGVFAVGFTAVTAVITAYILDKEYTKVFLQDPEYTAFLHTETETLQG